MSAKSKVTCLLQKAEELILIIKHEYRLRNWLDKIKVISVLANNIIVLRLITFYLVFPLKKHIENPLFSIDFSDKSAYTHFL